MAISDHRLRSGIILGSVTDALHQMAPSLGILPGMRVFVFAFYTRNLAHFYAKVNPGIEKIGFSCYNAPKYFVFEVRYGECLRHQCDEAPAG